MLSVLAVTFALQSHATSIYDPGIQYCQSNPSLCGLESSGSFEQGKQFCQQNPTSCGIPSDTNGSTADGISQCQNNPSSCSLESAGSFERGKTQGIQQGITQCQSNPSSCNIGTNDPNGSTAEGIYQCQNNPSSCSLESAGSFEGGKNQGIQKCQNDPISCNIPLAFIESIPRANFPDDPEILVYLSAQGGFTGNKQAIFNMGMNSWYNYQLVSRQRRSSTDPYIFDLKYTNGLQ